MTVSLNSHCILNFIPVRRDSDSSVEQYREPFSLLLEPRSLLILTLEAYTLYMHGIDSIDCDEITAESKKNIVNANMTLIKDRLIGDEQNISLNRRKRVSLTFRQVEKVIDGKKLFKFGPKIKR